MRQPTALMAFLVLTLTIAACSSTGSNTGAGGAQPAGKVTLFMVGDSTVSAFNDPYYYPRYGYGTQIGKYLTSAVTVNNLALSGRSSRSFISEPNYKTLLAGLKSGDYLMIGFGHNDEKADPGVYTDSTKDSSDPTSFKYYLWTYYLKPALDKGATPILCTPVVRRDASGVYANGTANVHVTSDAGSAKGGDYAQCIRDLGAEKKVTVIDATKLTQALGRSVFAAQGAAGTAKLQAWTSAAVGSADDTHMNIYGAAYYAFLIADALKSSDSSLKQFVLPAIKAPDPAILVVNPNYKAISYLAPAAKSQVWTKVADPWWGSVFGDIGGPDKVSDGTSFGIESTGPTSVDMHSGTGSGAVGKVAATSDGLAFYFQKLPVTVDFTLSATATVKFMASNDQVSFGLMVRDAVWMDVYDPSLLSPYVACGPLKITKGANAYSSFSRELNPASGTYALTGSAAITSTDVLPKVGTVVNLRIKKVGAVYTVNYGNEPAKTYTVDLNAVDPENLYVGLYTIRQCTVSFSNVNLTVVK